MKKLKEWMNPKYTKISIYAIIAALIVFSGCLLIYNYSSAAAAVFNMIGAIMEPLVLGLVIAYLLQPLAEILERRVFGKFKKKRVRRNLSVLLIVILLAMILAAGITATVIAVTKSVSAVDFSSLGAMVESLEKEFAEFADIIEKKLADLNIDFGRVGEKAIGFIGNIKNAGSTILFALIFAIYFLLDSGIGKYWNKAARVLLKEKTILKIKEFMNDADRVFSGYIRGQALDALIMGTVVTIAFLIAGVPYAAVVGILTGIGNLIPFVGPVVGFASLIIVCLTQMAFGKMIIGAIILVIIMAIDGNVISPKLLSTNVKIHPIVVFLALIAGGQIGGLVGMLVAVPCAALIKQQFEKYLDHRDQTTVEKTPEELDLIPVDEDPDEEPKPEM